MVVAFERPASRSGVGLSRQSWRMRMNIIEYLKRQHEEAKDVLDRIIAEEDKKEVALAPRANIEGAARAHAD